MQYSDHELNSPATNRRTKPESRRPTQRIYITEKDHPDMDKEMACGDDPNCSNGHDLGKEKHDGVLPKRVQALLKRVKHSRSRKSSAILEDKPTVKKMLSSSARPDSSGKAKSVQDEPVSEWKQDTAARTTGAESVQTSTPEESGKTVRLGKRCQLVHTAKTKVVEKPLKDNCANLDSSASELIAREDSAEEEKSKSAELGEEFSDSSVSTIEPIVAGKSKPSQPETLEELSRRAVGNIRLSKGCALASATVHDSTILSSKRNTENILAHSPCQVTMVENLRGETGHSEGGVSLGDTGSFQNNGASDDLCMSVSEKPQVSPAQVSCVSEEADVNAVCLTPVIPAKPPLPNTEATPISAIPVKSDNKPVVSGMTESMGGILRASLPEEPVTPSEIGHRRPLITDMKLIQQGMKLALNISLEMESCWMRSRENLTRPKTEKMSEPRAAGWALVDADGRKTTLSPMNLTVGGTLDSDVTIEGAEKNHALLIYSAADDRYKIQDLDSDIGTYVNDSRIPPEIPVTLDNMDSVTFGEDAMTYRVEQIVESVTRTSQQHVTDVTAPAVVTDATRDAPSDTVRHGETETRSARSTATESEVTSPTTARDMPTWATRMEKHDHLLAECPGCIAEQEIKHTCGGHDESSVNPSDTSGLPHAHPPPLSSVPHSVPHNHSVPHSQSVPHNHSVSHNHSVGNHIGPHSHSVVSHSVPAASAPQFAQPSGHAHGSRVAHYPPGHAIHYPGMDYHGYPPTSAQNGGNDDEEGKVYMYASSHSSSFSTQQYGYDNTQPPSSARSHEAAQSQMKRSKSAHFEYEQMQNFGPYPGDPYHYSRVYPPGYPPTFHPSHHPPHGYYPAPASHPGFGPYESRGYPPPPANVSHGCATCAALMAQYGYVPKEHLHDHAPRHSQAREEHAFREYPTPQGGLPTHQSPRSVPYPPREPSITAQTHSNEQFAQNTQNELVTPHIKGGALNDKGVMSLRRETSASHVTQHENLKTTQSHIDAKRQNRLSSSSDKCDNEEFNDNDLTSDIDLSAFSGSKHQTDSDPVFKHTMQLSTANVNQTSDLDNAVATGNNVAKNSGQHSNREVLSNSMPVPFQNHSDKGRLQTSDALSNSLPDTSTSAKTRELFARLEKASVQCSSASITVNAVSSGLPTASSVQSRPSDTNSNIDENIPERDTDVGCYNTQVNVDNNANKNAITGSPSVPRKDQRRNLMDGESQVKKNTPLYGEPAWWADEQKNGVETSEANQARPSSLVVDTTPDTDTASLQTAKSMDILLSNAALSSAPTGSDPTHTPPERDTGPVAPASTCSAPAHSGQQPVTASIAPAKSPGVAPAESSQCDSAKSTQDEDATETPRRGSNLAFTIDFSDNRGKEAESPSAGAPPTAFTIDFGGEDKKPKKFNMNDSLSQFLPTKVRKSFRDRSAKSKKSEDEQGQEELNDSQTGDDSSVSTPRQWNSPSTARRKSGGFNKQTTPKMARKTGYLSDGAHSTMSSDNEDLSFRSDYVTTRSSRKPTSTKTTGKQTRTEVTFSLKSPEKPGGQGNTVSGYRNKPISSSDSKMTRTARVLESMSVEKKLEKRILRSKSAGISLSKAGDISFDDSTHENTVSYTDPPPEYALYSEAKHFDSVIKSNSVHTIEPKKSPGESRPTRRSRNKGKESILRSRSVPRVLPDDPDNVSEAGTYTIDIDNKDTLKARKSIDQIFNVPGKKHYVSRRTPVRNSSAQYKLVENPIDITHPVVGSADINANFEDTEQPSGVREKESYVQHSSQSEEVRIEISVDDPSRRQSRNVSADPHVKLSGSADFEDLHKSERGVGSSSTPKTRRKLPTPPPNKTSSAEPSPRTPHSGTIESALRDHLSDLDIDPDSPGRQRGSVTISDKDRGECFMVSFDAPQRETPEMRDAIRHERDRVMVDDFFGVTTPPKTRERRVRNKPDKSQSFKPPLKVQLPPEDDNHNFGETARTEDLLGDSPRFERNLGLETGRSIDTQVLLQDTDEVMKVLEERGKIKTHTSSKPAAEFDVFDFENFKHSEDLKIPLHDGSDSDVSSTCAMADENLLSRIRKPPVQPKHHSSKLLSTKDRAMGRSKRSSHSSGDYYVGSDGHESEESGSIASSSTDYSHGHPTTSPKVARKNSADKTSAGRIANTRTNRAFALRRSRTETDDLETPKTDVTTQRSDTSKSSRSQLTTAKDTSRTDVSLGTKIVQKSRDNQKVKREDTFTRKDGGRFSLRAQRSSGALVSPSKIVANAKPTPDLSRPRAGRQTSVTAKGSSSKSGQPAKSVKKAEEHDAWKRRSKYDPRKAIAEAKAKEQEEKRQKRARSAGNTPDFEGRSRSDTVDSLDDSFALGAESLNMSGVGEDMDEITKLSSAVASDLSLLTASAQDERDDFSQDVTFRSSAFSSVSSIRNGSAFQSPSKNITPGGLCNPVAVKPSTALTQESESFDPVLVSSIYQLSQQIKTQTDKLLHNLKEEGLTSPLDDFISSHSASPELAATLENLKSIEHSLKVANSHLFPASGGSSPRDPDLHQQEMDRIRQELAGFKPIVNTKSTPSLLSSSKDIKLSASKRDPKYIGTGSMTSLTKTNSKSRTSFHRSTTKDAPRSYGPEYY